MTTRLNRTTYTAGEWDEIYFRMLPQILGRRHVLSTPTQGVEVQAYLATIACILILVHTGRT